MNIPITDIQGIAIGQLEDAEAGTGCTVIVGRDGMRAGVDVRGGGPASRETTLLDPLMSAQAIHAVVLGGGSAFGLAAADGVMEYLEEQDIGYDVGVTKVPLVVQSDIFDLTVGRKDIRPDRNMGRRAAQLALESPNYRDGNYGAGCGATVGKFCGMDHCTKTGIGSFAMQVGELQVGAVVVLNALGDIFDFETGRQIAGLLNEEKTGFRRTSELMKLRTQAVENRFVGNTTIGAVITNAYFGKTQLCKIAGMAHDGLARSVDPVHTSADGDSLYALSVGDVKADMDVVGTLAAEVVSRAIICAVESAESAFGIPSAASVRGE
ncbi:L-aminopeptidase/D-esterase [Ruminococcus sp. YE71]|uniref:P1 family peptidase n=1 Tax=unclassified Ruminococcus TaxID=2608920 RepID=UPI00088D8E2D|nr:MULTISPECIES: P1 family peptidase [unclassified Ruminococcus]SDA29810.1 L-aminopeptidase/D-esterase [Ruminococcus sp. YE78]SFW48894.1 L-aminopeptidase/D-esterase [Ruminococcus sp. YE71]